jgi:hypothetical protein
MQFGETVAGYDVPVLNEREARAGAGILFVFAFFAFMNAWFDVNFLLVRVFVIGFFCDFFMRVMVSPRYAPSLVLGRFFVQNQAPELVGATQKYFAWAIGFWIATFMMVLVGLAGQGGPLALAVCVVCLVLLFLESAFGICVACLAWNWFQKTPARLCPGGVCELRDRAAYLRVRPLEGMVLASFVVAVALALVAGPLVKQRLKGTRTAAAPVQETVSR